MVMKPKLKEIKFRPRTESHDLGYKVKHIRSFLDDGFRIRVVVQMRGRELAHPEYATKMLNTVLETIPGDYSVGGIKVEERAISTTLGPVKFQ